MIDRTLDIECYKDYLLVRFEDMVAPHTIHRFVMYPGLPLAIPAIHELLKTTRVYTFNGTGYDMPILSLALSGATNQQLKDAGDHIIQRGLKWWEFYDAYNVPRLDWVDHIDLQEPAPGVRIGLKMYMARMHAEKLQDLPIEPSASIGPVDRVNLDLYCGNDHDGTRMMADLLRPRLELRESLGQMFGLDLRSRSDAQIAEAVIKEQLGFKPVRRFIAHGFSFKYEAPGYIEFATPAMQEVLAIVQQADFVVEDKEQVRTGKGEEAAEGIRTGVVLPNEIAGRDIKLGRTTYRMGIGGLHSQEASVMHEASADMDLSDHDVASYYPSLILNLDMAPEQLGPRFLEIYRGVYEQRLAAKHAGRKTESDGLKIVLNGTFGKLFSKYSVLYAPELGIRTTLTGQLALLMLIEMLEISGIPVVSANTDGIVVKCPANRRELRAQIMQWWQDKTGLVLEDSFYRGIYSRDVNNYIAITGEGKAKRKGVFAKPGLLENKHPDKAICAEAVVQMLLTGKQPEHVIRECRDIRQFLQVRQVAGGASHNGQYLGKVVRWYYATGCEGYIEYAKNGNKVAGSDGAKPIMQLPTEFPDDVDYRRYINIAWEMEKAVGLDIPF